LRKSHFLHFEGLKVEIMDHFNSKPENYFSDGIAKLVERCNKCVLVKGDYIKKKIKFQISNTKGLGSAKNL